MSEICSILMAVTGRAQQAVITVGRFEYLVGMHGCCALNCLPQYPASDCSAPWLYYLSNKINPSVYWLEYGFRWVYMGVEPARQEISDLLLPLKQLLWRLMQQYKIVYISGVMPCTQLVLHKLVEFVQVDVGKKLAAEIAYWQAMTGRMVGQSLVWWHQIQHGRITMKYIISARVMKQDFPCEIQQVWLIDIFGQ